MSRHDAQAMTGPAVHRTAPRSALLLRFRWLLAGFAIGFITALSAGMGRTGQGPAEEIGQAFDRATRAGSDWMGWGGRSGGTGVDMARQVEDRLASDKGFDATKIEVRPGADGDVELHGIVANSEAKDRAVASARDTRGIRQVIDHLAVAPRARFVSSPEEPESADPGPSSARKAEPSPRVGRVALPPSKGRDSVR